MYVHPQPLVMPGLVPGSTFFVPRSKAWMAGTSPGMTLWKL